MADVRLRIEVNPNAESETLGDIVNNNAEVSNISVKLNSNNVFQNIPTSKSVGINGLSYSKDLVFDKDGYLDNEDLMGAVLESEENPTQFVWGIVSSNNEYHVKLTFTNASNLKDIVIYGDKGSNQFPTRAIIDNTTEISNDDFKWDIDLQTESDTHTIEFTHWNRANYNAIISMISVMMKYLEVDKNSGLKSVESLSQSTGQPKDVFYGLISNSGSANIFDIDGEIYDMIKGGVIENSNMPLEIIVNGNKVQSHISDDSSYNSNTKTFSVYMNDRFKSWDELMFSGMPLTDGAKSAYEILMYVMNSVGYNNEQVDNMLKNPIVYGSNNKSGTILEYLKTIQVQYAYIPSGTYREVIDKICSLAQLQMFGDNNGNPIFVSARPIISTKSATNAIVIPRKYMSSNLEKTIILKNKYDKIELEETIVEKVTIDNSNCGNATVENEGYEIEGLGAEINVSGYNVGIKLYFKTFTVTIPAKTNLNLNTTNNVTNFSSILNVGNNILIDNIKTYNFYPQGSTTPITISPQVILDRTGINIDKEKINSVKYNSDSDTFTISFVACVGRLAITKNSSGDLLENQNYLAENITFTFLGQQLQVQFNKSDVSESISNNPKTILKLNTNELLQSTAMVEDVKISTYIKNNIFNDYSNGVVDGTIKLFCGNMYNSNGELCKNWVNGEVVEVGDIVKIENDKMEKRNVYFKVTGRNFRKTGVPLIDLELQEVLVIS